jgi:uncharacterized cupredoxin-like copper-binding protein
MQSNRTPMIWPAITAVTVLFLIVMMVLQYQRTAPASAVIGAVDAQTAATGPVAVDVELTEFAISPDPVVVPAGVPVTLNVTNVGGLPHDLHVAGIAGTPEILSGRTEALALEPLEAGSYELVCELPGHEAAGMVATLEVTDDAVATPAAATAHGDHGDGHGSMTPEEMVEHHNEGIAKFLEGWGGTVYGNNLAEYTVDDDGAKVFELTADRDRVGDQARRHQAGDGLQRPDPRADDRADLGDTDPIVLTTR